MNLTAQITVQAQRIPYAPALMTDTVAVSYQDLDRAINLTANRFAKAGLGPGQIVGINCANKVQHLMAILATARIGAGHFSFRAWDAVSVQQSLGKRIGLSALISESQELDFGVPVVAPPPFGELEDLQGVPESPVPSTDDHDGIFLIMSTSGTTGTPKLVIITFAQFAARMTFTPPDTPGSRHLVTSPFSMILGKESLFRCLSCGGAFTLYDGDNIGELIEFINRMGITYYSGTPSHAGLMLEANPSEGCLFPSVDYFRIGSAFVPEQLRAELRARITRKLTLSYGATETGMVTFLMPDDNEFKRPGIVGTPTPMTELSITDDGRRVGVGEIGLLRVHSPRVASGYLDSPEESAKTFRDGWVFTNDRVELTPNGGLIHHGRVDDMIILEGVNIHPIEIENALLSHPAVADAAVFAVRPPNSGDKACAALVVKSPVTRHDIREHVESCLGTNRIQEIFEVAHLPRNPTGKVLVGELREEAERRMTLPALEMLQPSTTVTAGDEIRRSA